MIYIIDDEIDTAMKEYVDELGLEGFRVEGIRTTQDVITRLVGRSIPSKDCELIIVDMMMPRPIELPKNAPWNPLRSGGHLLEYIRNHAPLIPVLLFSNLPVADLRDDAFDRLGKWCADRSIERPHAKSYDDQQKLLEGLFRVFIHEKRQVPAWHLPVVVKEILARVSA